MPELNEGDPLTVQLADSRKSMQDNPVLTATRVNEIDFLRFVAAFVVMLFHYSFRGYAADGMSVMPYPALVPIAKYGYLGVQLFFLISGFVILMTASSGSLKKFFISRVIRLYPAFWACCTLTYIAILLIGGTRYTASISQYFVNMTMLNEFFYVPSIDGVYWSLVVEIKFYVLVGLILLIGQIERAQAFLVLWLLAVVALTLFPVAKLQELLIYDYAPYFIAGAMCFLVYSRGLNVSRLAIISTAWMIALRSSIQSIPGMEKHFHANFDGRVIAVTLSVFFVTMLLVSVKRSGFLAKREWGMLGALTYPLYLIHQKLGYMIFNLAYPSVNSDVLFWGTIALMLFIAYLVNVLIERKYSKKLKRILDNVIRVDHITSSPVR